MIRDGVSGDVSARHAIGVAGVRGQGRSLAWWGLRCDRFQLLVVVEVMYSDCS